MHVVAGFDLALVARPDAVAAIALLHERTIRQAQVLTEQLQGALNSRVVIEQAKGAVAQTRGVSVDEAFTLIRRYARNNNRRLGEVAQALVANIENIPALAHSDRRPGGDAASGRGDTVASGGRGGHPEIRETSTYAAPDIHIRRRLLTDGQLCLHVSGEVDTDSSGRLEVAIQDVMSEAAHITALIIDLGRVPFLDSSGIRVLLNGHRRAAEHGIPFRVVNPSDLVRRVLAITEVLAMLTDGTWPDLPDTPHAQSA